MMWNSMVWLLIECDGAENWNWIFKNDYNDDDSDENRTEILSDFLGPSIHRLFKNDWMNDEIHMIKVAAAMNQDTHHHTHDMEKNEKRN